MVAGTGAGRTSLHCYLLTRLAVLLLAAVTLVAMIVWLTLHGSAIAKKDSDTDAHNYRVIT